MAEVELQMFVAVKLASIDLPFRYVGDVQFGVSDAGVLSVYNYSLRERQGEHSGLVLVAAPGQWEWARHSDG